MNVPASYKSDQTHERILLGKQRDLAKVIEFTTPGSYEVLEIADRSKPVPAARQLLVRVKFAAVNAIDNNVPSVDRQAVRSAVMSGNERAELSLSARGISSGNKRNHFVLYDWWPGSANIRKYPMSLSYRLKSRPANTYNLVQAGLFLMQR